MNNQGKSRWGFDTPMAYQGNQAVEVAPVAQQVTVDTAKVISVQNKSIDSLSNTIQVLTVDKEKLQRQLLAKDTQIDNINRSFNAASDKILSLERELATLKDSYKNTQASTYASSGYAGNTNMCAEVSAPIARTSYPVYKSTPTVAAVATTYKQPINPMTTFVEFLEELNILEDYMKILMGDGNSMETLCGQYDPSDYINHVCTDDDGDLLPGWDEADALWQEICEADDLDQHEAYVE